MKFHYGYISEVDDQTGFYRVNLEELEIVSPWMPALFLDTKDTKDENSFVVNQHVAVLLKNNFNEGVILGAIYDRKNPPSVKDKNKRVTTFIDGSTVSFNKSTGEYGAHYKGKSRYDTDDINQVYGTNGIELNGNSNGGLVKVGNNVTHLNVIEGKINDLITIFTTWTPVPNDGGGALKAALTTWVASVLTLTVVPDLENPTAKH